MTRTRFVGSVTGIDVVKVDLDEVVSVHSIELMVQSERVHGLVHERPSTRQFNN